MRRTIVLLLFIALLLPSVSAQEFLAFGDTSITVQPCNSATGNVTIQNTAQEQTTYSLSVDGTGSDYVTFSTLAFVLDSGQATTINTFYKIPCDVRPGEYPVTIYFSDGELELELPQAISVKIPDNINITTTQTSAVIAPCDTAAYTIDLHNTAGFTEIYTISASGHPNVHVSEKQAVLEAGQHKNIIISVTPDDCTQSGIFPLTAEFDTEKSQQHKEQVLEFIIKATDIPVLAEGVNKIRTDYVDSTAELTIENTGDRVTQYGLTIEGADWATVIPNSVTLNPGETKTLALRLAPTKDVPKGTYQLSFVATVEQTGIRYSKDLTINLKPTTIVERNPAIVLAIAIIILAVLAGAYYSVKYFRSPAFKETLRRWKEKREIARKARAQKRAELIKRKLEQQRKDAERKKAEAERKQAEKDRITKQLQRQVEKDFKKEYHIVAKKDLILGHSKKSVLKSIAIALGIAVLILIIAAWALIAPNFAYVILGLVILGVILLAKIAARNKIIRAQWKTVLAKQTINLHCWKKGLSLLGITAEDPIKQLKLIVKKIKARAQPSPAVYQTFLLKTNAPEDALSCKATFTISKRWMARKNIDAADVKLARYTNQNWSTISLKKTGESKTAVHYTAELNKTGTYSIYARPGKQQSNKSRKLIWGIIGIALIAAIAVVLSPQPNLIAKGIPSQQWQQDLVHKIDLGEYFNDPDGDKLNYTATETKHITIDISGSTAFMTPETGWTGEERVRFIASDNKGGQVASNTVPLRVQKMLIPQKIQPYIAILLSIITIILLIWTVRVQTSKNSR